MATRSDKALQTIVLAVAATCSVGLGSMTYAGLDGRLEALEQAPTVRPTDLSGITRELDQLQDQVRELRELLLQRIPAATPRP